MLGSEGPSSTPEIKETIAKTTAESAPNLIDGIDEVTAAADLQVLKNASIEDIRSNPLLLIPDSEGNPLKKIKNIKAETSRRMKAYTTYDEGWYTLNYHKVGGENHNRKVGLGEILIDPEIIAVAVKMVNGKEIVAQRSIGPDGRIGFFHEDKYVATFTGDQFRILKGAKEAKVRIGERRALSEEVAGGPNTTEAYLKAFEEESKARQRHKEHLAKQKFLSERSQRIYELMNAAILQVKGEKPGFNEQQLYLEAEKLLEEQLGKEADEAKKEELKMAASECKSNAEALAVSPDFNLSKYKNAISMRESGSDAYLARNDAEGLRRGVDSSRWAFGKYQFITPTANSYGAHLNPENEESVQAFLDDPLLQEQIMNAYTMANLQKWTQATPETRAKFTANGYDVYMILAAQHIGGAGAIDWPNGDINDSADWLGTPMSTYIKALPGLAVDSATV